MRLEKKAIVDEMGARIAPATFLFVADYRGLKVEQFSELRRQLDKAGARVLVVKNRLFKQVDRDRGWTKLDESLRGQSAIVTGTDVVQTAKVLAQFAEANGVPKIKAGMLGDAYLSPADAAALARLPSRETLYAMLVGALAAPMSRLVGTMRQKMSSLVYVLKAVEEKKKATQG